MTDTPKTAPAETTAPVTPSENNPPAGVGPSAPANTPDAETAQPAK